MKKISFLLIILFSNICFSQNIKCETTEYSKKHQAENYSTYHYIQSSYSHSRPILIMVTNNKIFMNEHIKIPKLFSFKQEYTDVYLLGIDSLVFDNLNQSNNEIIDLFINSIIKYRDENKLPVYSSEQIKSKIIFLNKNKDLCKYLICDKK